MKWFFIFVLLLIAMPFVLADDIPKPTEEDKAQFDQILTPVVKIYQFVQYAALVIGALIFLISGIVYMTSGHDPKQRETAKNMATYVIIGLVLICAAPFIVKLIIGN
ncbi:MAG: pilin [Candidatus Woesearchaeota archaeon]|jgi:hypothetical protein